MRLPWAQLTSVCIWEISFPFLGNLPVLHTHQLQGMWVYREKKFPKKEKWFPKVSPITEPPRRKRQVSPPRQTSRNTFWSSSWGRHWPRDWSSSLPPSSWDSWQPRQLPSPSQAQQRGPGQLHPLTGSLETSGGHFSLLLRNHYKLHPTTTLLAPTFSRWKQKFCNNACTSLVSSTQQKFTRSVPSKLPATQYRRVAKIMKGPTMGEKKSQCSW